MRPADIPYCRKWLWAESGNGRRSGWWIKKGAEAPWAISWISNKKCRIMKFFFCFLWQFLYLLQKLRSVDCFRLSRSWILMSALSNSLWRSWVTIFVFLVIPLVLLSFYGWNRTGIPHSALHHNLAQAMCHYEQTILKIKISLFLRHSKFLVRYSTFNLLNKLGGRSPLFSFMA